MRQAKSQLRIVRVYEPASAQDGNRILVDRIWPRGISKEKARVSHWLKEIAPTTELRKWFGHDPVRFDEFAQRYRAELEANQTAVQTLRDMIAQGPVTLVYSAHDTEHNQARVLAEFMRGE
jgi:uncharacterized protein YeaO (DUF488 family)